MHLALQIDEILVVIMHWVRWVDSDTQNWCSGLPKGIHILAALARTCKTFSDPALNELWHSQECISHLLLLSDAVEQHVVMKRVFNDTSQRWRDREELLTGDSDEIERIFVSKEIPNSQTGIT